MNKQPSSKQEENIIMPEETLPSMPVLQNEITPITTMNLMEGNKKTIQLSHKPSLTNINQELPNTNNNINIIRSNVKRIIILLTDTNS